MERKSENIQRAIVQELNNIMVENDQVVVVNADIALLFKDGPDSISCPDRVLDVGIAEQNMIGFASGLAYSGKTVFTTTIAEMAVARVIEQIRLDGCYPDLNINMFGQGRGFAYGIGGNSHIINEDFAMLRGIPNIKIIIPAAAREARKVMHEALSLNGTKYIAICRGNKPNVYEDCYEFHIRKAVTMRDGMDVTIIAVGDMVAPALDSVEILKEKGITTEPAIQKELFAPITVGDNVLGISPTGTRKTLAYLLPLLLSLQQKIAQQLLILAPNSKLDGRIYVVS